jgi:hypothetical protein
MVQMANTTGTGDKTGLDETRRLLYMALLVNRTKRYNLAGTLVNALAHHHAVDDLGVTEITDHVVDVIESKSTGEFDVSRAWVREQIDRITAELGD